MGDYEEDSLGGPLSLWQAAWTYAGVMVDVEDRRDAHRADEVRVMLARALTIAAHAENVVPAGTRELAAVTDLEGLALEPLFMRFLPREIALPNFIDLELGAAPGDGEPGYETFHEVAAVLEQHADELLHLPSALDEDSDLGRCVKWAEQAAAAASGVVLLSVNGGGGLPTLRHLRHELAAHLGVQRPAPGNPELWHARLAWAERFLDTESLDLSYVRQEEAVEVLSLAAYGMGMFLNSSAESEPELDRLLAWLAQPGAFETMLRIQLGGDGHRLGPVDPTDPVSQQWGKLAFLGDRLATVVNSMERAVGAVLGRKRGAWRRYTHVRITSGVHVGQRGRVEGPVWDLGPRGTQVQPGPVTAYSVLLAEPAAAPESERTVTLAVTDLERVDPVAEHKAQRRPVELLQLQVDLVQRVHPHVMVEDKHRSEGFVVSWTGAPTVDEMRELVAVAVRETRILLNPANAEYQRKELMT